MLKILANKNTNSIHNAGMFNDKAAGNNRSDDIPNEQNPSVPTICDEIENESSQINERHVCNHYDEEVNQEDNQVNTLNIDGYQPLFKAIDVLDWKTVKKYIHDHQTTIKEIFITRDSRKEIHTILNAAACCHQFTFLKEFLKMVPPEMLEFVDPDVGYTILHKVAHLGEAKFVMALVEKNSNLMQIRSSSNDKQQCVPLVTAAGSCVSDGQKEVVEYLWSVTRDTHPSPFTGEQVSVLLIGLVRASMYGIALSVCQRFPGLVKVEMAEVLNIIVERPFAFLSGSNLNWWQRSIYALPLIRKLYDQKLMHKQAVALTKYFLALLQKKRLDKVGVKEIFLKLNLLKMAMKFGTTEFVLESLRVFPFLCLHENEGDISHTCLKLVLRERNEMIYNFMCILKQGNLRDMVSTLDESNNSILHYCAELPHNRRLNAISGAAFQMQQEIQWFKWVESTMVPADRFVRNKDGDTAHMLFTEKHKGLMKEGEKWMKDLSTSCMVVAALISTAAFTAAITVPGGNHANGLPVLLNWNSFMVFVAADSLALFSSIISVLMFLAVFTSRYSEEDFLKALPQRLILGLATLFISMASILVSFGATFIIILGKRIHWAPVSVSLFSCAPVLLFGFLQFPLFVEMVISTYWPIISRKQDYRIYEPYFSETEWTMFLGKKKGER
ncbi:uncharacterized protein LOC113311214 [Papaver somniferum]|uniref:uncharacterized protein LOC113311214 n=1 Tax=Papaver somniferum TaxID=3469 RepID=UPI000E6F5BC3|nr:uncharacterized protein LOC113311214 [Papaver somniferum]